MLGDHRIVISTTSTAAPSAPPGDQTIDADASYPLSPRSMPPHFICLGCRETRAQSPGRFLFSEKSVSQIPAAPAFGRWRLDIFLGRIDTSSFPFKIDETVDRDHRPTPLSQNSKNAPPPMRPIYCGRPINRLTIFKGAYGVSSLYRLPLKSNVFPQYYGHFSGMRRQGIQVYIHS